MMMMAVSSADNSIAADDDDVRVTKTAVPTAASIISAARCETAGCRAVVAAAPMAAASAARCMHPCPFPTPPPAHPPAPSAPPSVPRGAVLLGRGDRRRGRAARNSLRWESRGCARAGTHGPRRLAILRPPLATTSRRCSAQRQRGSRGRGTGRSRTAQTRQGRRRTTRRSCHVRWRPPRSGPRHGAVRRRQPVARAR